ncbi:DUF2461 domain-containing protein [Desertihabitans brevis]|uniref:DUF2461 domain-containing protein n=1 Tax=Desertihabitans brevis TaxID=2268447 RepID=A0A367YY20_9ACTN|nr:DUF2461 domain-containing protein [Desertihabitans brevis]RCK70754.1 DUF2461 domain-containing protein [Desertihabitans brevis]
MAFSGIPEVAFDFYDDLETDNSRSFFEAHRSTYEESVRRPVQELCALLAEEFGEAKLFRPHRDVRFSKDKSPYKTHQGAYVATGPATGWYLEVSAAGVRVGAGFYDAEPARLAAIRAAVADERSGPALRRVLTTLEKRGFEVGGDRLKTSPRGYPADHPRISLLRHKTLAVSHVLGFGADVTSPALADLVRADWRACRPLLTWLERATA